MRLDYDKLIGTCQRQTIWDLTAPKYLGLDYAKVFGT